MSIVRLARKTQFYTLPTATIEDTRLSWEARGLLVHLLSKPDNWNVSVKYLISQTKDCLGKRSGRDKVYAILQELRMAGYVRTAFKRVEGGVFKGVIYEVSEDPDIEAGAAYIASLSSGPDQPFPANPDTVVPIRPLPDLPDTVAPLTANPEALVKIERAIKTEKAVKNPTADPEQAGGSTGEGSLDAIGAEAKAAGMPDSYPRDPASLTYPAWMAYAKAFKARYRQWPIYNATVGGQMAKVVNRIGAEAAEVAAYFVEKVEQPYVVSTCHTAGSLLKNCETYAVQAREAIRIKKRAEANQRAADQALAAAPVAGIPHIPKAAPKRSSSADEARALLRQSVGIRPKASGGQ